MSGSVESLCLERDDGRCFRCGIAIHDTWSRSCHHRRLRSAQGTDTLENRIMLCGSGTTGCHGWVHANPAKATEQGWIVSRYGPGPEGIPVKHWYWGKVYLTADGAVNPWGEE